MNNSIKHTGATHPMEAIAVRCGSGARRQKLEHGDKLFTPGGAAENVYYIHNGQIRLFQIGDDESTRLVDIHGAGSLLGMTTIARLPSHNKLAVAVGSTEVSAIPLGVFLHELTRDPNLSMQFVQAMARRLCEQYDNAAQFVFDDCRNRLLKTLLRFSTTPAASHKDGMVTLRLTHEQLAQAIGVARETVSLTIVQLRKERILHSGRSAVTFDPGMLAKSVGKPVRQH